MAKLIGRSQVTINTLQDAYNIGMSVKEYIFPSTNTGVITELISFTSALSVTQGGKNIIFSIGTVAKPTGFSTINIDNVAKTITFSVAANTSNLADNGLILIPVIIEGVTYNQSFIWSKTKKGDQGNAGQDGYSITASRLSCILSTDKDGKLHTAVSTSTIISVYKGSASVTPTIGSLPTVAGCSLTKSGATVTLTFNIGTSLAESGIIDIPVSADGKNFNISFAYAKARTGANGQTGAAGVDANMLDWVKDWNTNKTVIGSDTIITPKIFAGTKNSNGTLTGVALGRFALSTYNASGSIVTETINGIYSFKDGYKTFFVDSGGNAQLGRDNQSIKYNASNGKIEFGSEVSLNWINAINTAKSEAITIATNDSKKLINEASTQKIRYIRDWLNGSTSNTGNHWVQIKALDYSGNNIALNKSVSGATSDKRITNGNIDSNPYASGTAGLQNVIVDLGDAFDIEKVQVWHYYQDARTYYSTKTEVSLDGQSWYTIFNSAKESTYKENSQGRSFLVKNYDRTTDLENAVTKGTRFYAGKFTFNHAAPHTTNLGFDTKIPFSDGQMWLLEISGFAYGSNQSLRIDLMFYAGGGNYGSVGYTSTSSLDVTKVRLGIKNGFISVELNFASNISFLNLDVQAVATRWNTNKDVADGWISRPLALDGSYSYLIDVPRRQTIQDVAAANAKIAADEAKTAGVNAQSIADAITKKSNDEKWATKLTYIDSTGIFTGTLSANTVNAIKINAVQIISGTIDAARINVAALKSELITAGNIDALTLNVVRGKIGGWNIDTDSIFGGTKNNTIGTFTAGSSSMTIGSNGIRGFKWRFDINGAGALAGGNISWDTSGNVTFGSSVILNWTNVADNALLSAKSYADTKKTEAINTAATDVNNKLAPINTALGGTSYPKLTQISSTGIYTGTLTATQVNAVSINANSIKTGILSADRIAAGSIHSTKLEAASIKAYIINTDYINGLTCTFVRGQIGGWSIGSDTLAIGAIGAVGQIPLQIRSTSVGSGNWYNGAYKPYGLSMLWYQNSNAGHLVFGQVAANGTSPKSGFIGLQMMAWDNTEYFCLSANYTKSGAKEVYNRIAGWAFDSTRIWKNNVTLGADGGLYNGNLWKLNNDGSGQIANGNISWNAVGTVTFSSSVSLNWTTNINSIITALGGSAYPKLTQINSSGIYTGTLNANQINAGTISSDRLDAGTIKANIINTSYINGLSCTFDKGKIGGWTISSDSMYIGNIGGAGAVPIQIRSNSTGSGYVYNGQYKPYGITISWHQSSNAGHLTFGQVMTNGNTPKAGFVGIQMMAWDNTEYFCLSTNYTKSGAKEVYNRIAGWGFDNTRIWKNNVFLGPDGSIQNSTKWQLNNDGAGRIANGNIVWDTNGNVTFGSSVSLNWTAGINNITTALGGSSYTKLTKIDATGIYTGIVKANQVLIDSTLVVGGSTYNGSVSVRDASNAVKVTLDRTGINAVGGIIGGWTISSTQISKSSVILGADGSITNGTKWKLNLDGSGQVANGNVSWTAAGAVTVTGTVNATSGKIGGFAIEGNKLSNNAGDSCIAFNNLDGASSVSINESSSALLSLRADSAKTAINIQTYYTGAIGISIVANAGSTYAIASAGPHRFYQRYGEVWNAPGVLFSAVVKNSNTLYNQWGNGLKVTSFYRTSTGQFMFYHNLGHTDYTVMATPYWDTSTNWHSNSFVRVEYISSNSFKLRVVNADNGGLVDTCFTFCVIGRNSYY